MKKFSFSTISKERLNTCHADLIKITTKALELSHVDFGISQGERTIADQQKYFDQKKSRVNPKAYATPQKLAAAGKHIATKNSTNHAPLISTRS